MNHCIFVVFFSTFTKSGIADIIGGTGYIFGLIDVALYVANKKGA